MYLRPDELSQALLALKSAPLTVLAGGTDFYPARVGRPIAEDVLDITAIRSLRGVSQEPEWLRIGALTTWSDLISLELPPVFASLQAAAREIGGVQIQNTGTIAGNICNASPAADGVPVLLALDAQVELTATDNVRRVALESFVTGSRRTGRRPDELVTALLVPAWGPGARGTFLKLGARRYLVISIVMVAVTVEANAAGTVERARVAVGACSEVAQRLRALETRLCGEPLSPALADLVQANDFAQLSPRSDIRGSADYRNDAAQMLVRRALTELSQ